MALRDVHLRAAEAKKRLKAERHKKSIAFQYGVTPILNHSYSRVDTFIGRVQFGSTFHEVWLIELTETGFTIRSSDETCVSLDVPSIPSSGSLRTRWFHALALAERYLSRSPEAPWTPIQTVIEPQSQTQELEESDPF